MDWIRENLSWLVPVAITLLGVPGFLAFKFPNKFPEVVGWRALMFIGGGFLAAWAATTGNIRATTRTLIACGRDCNGDFALQLANDINRQLEFQFLAAIVAAILAAYIYVLTSLPRKLIGK